MLRITRLRHAHVCDFTYGELSDRVFRAGAYLETKRALRRAKNRTEAVLGGLGLTSFVVCLITAAW